MILRWSFTIWPRHLLGTMKSNRTETCPKKDFPPNHWIRKPSIWPSMFTLPSDASLSLSPRQGMLLRPPWIPPSPAIHRDREAKEPERQTLSLTENSISIFRQTLVPGRVSLLLEMSLEVFLVLLRPC